MSDELAYGQQRQMEDASMVETLRAQAEMIWPLEEPIVRRLGLTGAATLADLGCGTGEFAGRVARACPQVRVTGVDLFDRHVEIARDAWAADELDNLSFVQGDARSTGWADGSFAAVSIRHMLHALPDVSSVLAEARRILEPGGLLYVLDEDYAGLLFHTDSMPARRLFQVAEPALAAHDTHLYRGRETFRDLRAAGFADVRVDPIVVDTVNTAREPFARMMRYWRDGYADFIADAAGVAREDIHGRFDAICEAILDPERYSCWLLFAVSGRAPA